MVDYLRGGTQIALMVGIDFTASNGTPTSSSSLHYFDKNSKDTLNQYQQAILSIGEVLLNYDSDKLVGFSHQIPVYGFGAELSFPNMKKGVLSHFFPCSGDFANPAGHGVEGIFQLYHHCLSHVSLSGPTLFAPLLKEIVGFTRSSFKQDPNTYSVLLILTDGCINDMQATKDAIVEGSELPLSIIIVGVGNANFANMEALDSDDKVALPHPAAARRFQSDGQKGHRPVCPLQRVLRQTRRPGCSRPRRTPQPSDLFLPHDRQAAQPSRQASQK